MAAPIALPRIRGIQGAGRLGRVPPLKAPARIREEPVTANMTERVKRAYYDLCGPQDARAVLAYNLGTLLETYPRITLPESILYKLLVDERMDFSYQSAFDGGRSQLGGAVVDFVIRMGGYSLAVLVNGDYWHMLPQQMLRDMVTVEQVTGQVFDGSLIAETLTIWESTLLGCNRDRAFQLLLTGVEVGRNF